MSLNHTDRATLAGLYLALFDKRALSALGCSGVWQAFNVLGYSLGSNPASIKNYRDEFDHEISKTNPSHPRKGWKRPLKTRSKNVYAQFSHLEFNAFTDLVKGFLLSSYEKEKLIAGVTKQRCTPNVAQRLMTGRAAEAYFKLHYAKISSFAEFSVEDVTSCGCGYDFHLSCRSAFYCVEVKGLGANTGSVVMTEKEYAVAGELGSRYCLFVVRNFQQTPSHSLFFDPVAAHALLFTPQSRTVTSYSAYL
jgi:hypothetical protein